MNQHEEIKIIICNSCKGDGIDELVKKGYVSNNNKCRSCNGSGRQYEAITKKWSPYISAK